jgi:ribonucleoside-triphosphate reductase
MNQVIKRDSRVVPFNPHTIENAILKAFKAVDGDVSEYAQTKAKNIAEYIAGLAKEKDMGVEEIQDLVEKGLCSTKRKDVAKAYILYREDRTRARGNTIDKTVQEIVQNTNDYWKNENSNKNPQILSTQRDYIAGAVSTDISKRIILPKDVVEAHEQGIIHVHDMDYLMQHMFNCCLVNLEDMLQNGTVISGNMIEKPHSFATACNIATQIMAQVASNQYGGQSETLSHLAPFVDISRQNYRNAVRAEFYDMMQEDELAKMPSDETINRIAEARLKKEIKAGVQTIQYQISTLMTTNG